VHRVAHRLTQQQLADRAGITRITVSALEREQCEPRLATARALAAALGGVDIADLFPDAGGGKGAIAR